MMRSDSANNALSDVIFLSPFYYRTLILFASHTSNIFDVSIYVLRTTRTGIYGDEISYYSDVHPIQHTVRFRARTGLTTIIDPSDSSRYPHYVYGQEHAHFAVQMSSGFQHAMLDGAQFKVDLHPSVDKKLLNIFNKNNRFL